MGGYSNFYSGANYGLNPDYDGDFLGFQYRSPASSISLATDARTANQIQATTEKLNTGAKSVEVQAVSPEIADAIPKEHFVELNRLKQLTGVNFTFHGPLVEPTGVTKQGWDDTHRQQSERQMWSAIERGQKLEKDGNLVITFHSSTSLPEPISKVKDENGNEKDTSMFFVDERTGQFTPVNLEKHYFPGTENMTIQEEMKKKSEEEWDRNLQHISFNAHTGSSVIDNVLRNPIVLKKGEREEKLQLPDFLDYYKSYGSNEFNEKMGLLQDEAKEEVKEKIKEITHAHLYLRDAYGALKTLYDNAYSAAEKGSESFDPEKRRMAKEDLEKLQRYKEELIPKVKYLEDPTKVQELANEIVEGVNILRSIDKPMKFTPLRDFAIDKASETFSNLAFRSYNEFKDNAPIMSIENPPAGQGLSKAEDLRDLVEASRQKLIRKLQNENDFSEEDATKQAEKLIGVTWDVGHINMIKKYGYNDKDLLNQSKIVKDYVKNIHLSDNFGMEHTELPMGMGNVPIKEHMKILEGYKKQLNKVIETGQWYQYFKTTPYAETLSAFGSPIYAMEMGPTWNQAYGMTGGNYFAGLGMNPDVHHSYFGAGFSNLPLELGGQPAGRSNSRFSGAPID